MTENSLCQILKRLANRVTKAEIRPSSFLRSFSLSFSALLKAATPPRDIVASLLKESVRHRASDINMEPAPGDALDIYFRIDGVLHKVAIVQATEANRLRSALQSQSQRQCPGLYNVIESTITITDQGTECTFSVYYIPQIATDCILIRPCPTANKQNTAPNRQKIQHPPAAARNIDKKIFVWQMGKVGSLSVYSSLFQHSKPCKWDPPSIKHDTHWPKHNNIIQTHSIKLLYDFLHYSDVEFVVISLVRDLLSRNISSIFQSMNFQEEWRNQFFIASIKDFQKMPYERQEQEITKQLLTLNTSTLTTGWFDNLLKSHFYYPDIDKYFIDIYAKPFDQDKGFQIYESKTPRIQMIILRLEDLTEREKELGDFLGLENFRLASGNRAEDKWYRPIYKRFKERYRPTPQELEAIYNSRFMRYFYSQDQIDSLTARWE